MDLAGYDIINMVEDINDLRQALGYEKITLRGTSFGSQWSFAYIQKYGNHVDRAVLSGVEPLDHGYDSHDGVWNVLLRIQSALADANDADNRLKLPDMKLTEAIKKVVQRLTEKEVMVDGHHPRNKSSRTIPIGVGDFQRILRTGILARRESAQSLQNFPKFVFEILDEDYRYLASRIMQERSGSSGASLQTILIDNSLGISQARDSKLDSEPARKWLGELNYFYKATRDVTPTPVIPDAFRVLKSDLPILFVQGDMDLSTPIENAEEALQTLTNCHMIRIARGTHGAFDQIADHDPSFLSLVVKFLNADFEGEKSSVRDLKLPTEMALPLLQFKPLSGPSLFDESIKN